LQCYIAFVLLAVLVKEQRTESCSAFALWILFSVLLAVLPKEPKAKPQRT